MSDSTAPISIDELVRRLAVAAHNQHDEASEDAWAIRNAIAALSRLRDALRAVVEFADGDAHPNSLYATAIRNARAALSQGDGNE